MKQTRITAGLVLALASTAVFAASGDQWYGTHRGIVYEPIVEPIRVDVVSDRELLYPDRELVYVERDVMSAPLIVDRSYVERPGYGVYESNMIKPLNPETGHLIGHGLFNTRGPNDFGS